MVLFCSFVYLDCFMGVVHLENVITEHCYDMQQISIYRVLESIKF